MKKRALALALAAGLIRTAAQRPPKQQRQQREQQERQRQQERLHLREK